MLRYILRRLWQSVFVLIGVSIIAFLLMRLTPGNPAALLLGDGATSEQIALVEAKLGLDKPLYEQYFIYMKNVCMGDLGTSIYFDKPNSELIAMRLPSTALLTSAAILLALVVAIPLGLIAGLKKGSFVDFLSMFFALVGQAMSPVWLGLVLILVFAVSLGWLPALGTGSLKNMIMPAITLGLPMAALLTRMMRSGTVDVMQEDYITATYAKGVRRFDVVTKYGLRNSILPVITIVGIQFSTFMGGAVTTETIFVWPGIGNLSVQAINARDFGLVQSILLVISALIVIVNLLVDIIYTLVDPRLR